MIRHLTLELQISPKQAKGTNKHITKLGWTVLLHIHLMALT